MDPLSVSESVVALITLTGTVTTCLNDIRNALKDAPNDLLTVLKEIEEFQTVLSIIRDIWSESPSDAFRILSSPASRAKHKLLELEKILHYEILQGAPIECEKPELSKWRWIRARGKIEAIRKDLQDIRVGVVTALSSLTARSAVTADTRLRRIEDFLKELGTITEITKSIVLTLPSSADLAPGPHANGDSREDEEQNTSRIPTEFVQASQPLISGETTDHQVALHTNMPTPPGWHCDPWCACLCHKRQRWGTPALLWSLLGSLHLDYAGAFLSKTPCTESRCRPPFVQSTKFTYRFPTWLAACVITASLGGPSTCLRASRVVPTDAPLMKYAQDGNVEGIKGLFRSGLASPWDVNEFGWTALDVSPTFFTRYFR